MRRETWRDKFYIYYEDGIITDSDDNARPLFAPDVFSEDWEVYDPILENGTLVKTDDGTAAIILDYDSFTKAYTYYTENECVEKNVRRKLTPIKTKELRLAINKFNDLLSFMRHVSK